MYEFTRVRVGEVGQTLGGGGGVCVCIYTGVLFGQLNRIDSFVVSDDYFCNHRRVLSLYEPCSLKKRLNAFSKGIYPYQLEMFCYLNPLIPDDKILDWSKLKQIADDILKCILNGK